MSGHTSHNVPTRRDRRRRAWISVAAGSAFLAALTIAVLSFPDTQVGRTLNAHLSLLADPYSWVP